MSDKPITVNEPDVQRLISQAVQLQQGTKRLKGLLKEILLWCHNGGTFGWTVASLQTLIAKVILEGET